LFNPTQHQFFSKIARENRPDSDWKIPSAPGIVRERAPIQTSERQRVGSGRTIMRSYSPELVQIMRSALDEVMTQIPLEWATLSIKAHMAEIILDAAAGGETTYDGLVAAASRQIHVVLSVPT
jgi:hypothetical protein